MPELLIPIGIIGFFALFIVIAVRSGLAAGRGGEAIVAGRLDELPCDEYKVVNDVMLPTKDGMTTQIDHIVVCRFGIFVIETKDYSGWIFGNEKQCQWTQTLHARWRGTEKHHFQNPIRQNWRHIFTLADLLELPTRYFHNVVAFSGNAELKTEMPKNVMYSAGLVCYIKSFNRPLLSSAGVARVVRAIRTFEATLTEERREAHVANLKARHDPVQLAVAASTGKLKCPKCGSPMVLRHRHSDNRRFYGCSRYPACRGVLKAD